MSDVPQHVAIIMDGNGRWATARGMSRFLGHRAGAESAKTAIRAAHAANIPYLSLYAFSRENIARPEREVQQLIKLYHELLKPEHLKSLMEKGIALRFIGDVAALDAPLAKSAAAAQEETAVGQSLTVIVALNYSGRWDILQAAQALFAQSNPLKQLQEQDIERHLSLYGIPDPDLLIRTGGETRVSNFLLWQLAYTELFFTDVHWPNFDAEVFAEALSYYATRERRFGRVGESCTEES